MFRISCSLSYFLPVTELATCGAAAAVRGILSLVYHTQSLCATAHVLSYPFHPYYSDLLLVQPLHFLLQRDHLIIKHLLAYLKVLEVSLQHVLLVRRGQWPGSAGMRLRMCSRCMFSIVSCLSISVRLLQLLTRGQCLFLSEELGERVLLQREVFEWRAVCVRPVRVWRITSTQAVERGALARLAADGPEISVQRFASTTCSCGCRRAERRTILHLLHL